MANNSFPEKQSMNVAIESVRISICAIAISLALTVIPFFIDLLPESFKGFAKILVGTLILIFALVVLCLAIKIKNPYK